jgi:putative ABC transport system ATP-binding protein
MSLVIQTTNLIKTYHIGDIDVHAVNGINLSVERGEFIAIMGASGSGKSTLMNLIGCLDRPTSGDYYLDGIDINKLDRNHYAEIRNQKIGFVFQGFNLIPRTSALENVELPLFYDRSHRIIDPKKKSMEALKRVGLEDRMYHDPNQLSGGQQQRVAIARAIVNNPDIILADEPTGNLDSVTSIEVMALFQELHEQGITIILVTHENDISEFAQRIIDMKDGKIVFDIPVTNRRNAIKKLQEFNKVSVS